MEECRLGYNALHVIPSPAEDIPPNYVVVQYTCPCGEVTTQFALHHILLQHLMGRPGNVLVGPEARPYFQMLTALQAEAILAGRRTTDTDEESPDR